MKRKHRRLAFVAAGMVALGAAAALVLVAFEDSLVFFFSPTDLAEKHVPEGRRVRIGGLVEEGSLKRLDDGVSVEFRVTDLSTAVRVTYKGVLPDLFGEGQGVVTEGYLRDGIFVATEVLAKHDENYLPREVVDALKEQGHWETEEDTGADAGAAGGAGPYDG